MKINRCKKTRGILVACMLLVLTTVTCFAATHYIVYNGIPTKENVKEQAGLSPKYVEEFQNGYSYLTGGIDKDMDLSDGSNVLDIRYIKDDTIVHYHAVKAIKGETSLEDINPHNGEIKEDISITSEIPGICIESKAKIVPMDYEMTEQDKKDEKSSLYVFINKPVEEVNVVDSYSIMWEDDGILYRLAEYDGMLDKSEMIDMAKEIVVK